MSGTPEGGGGNLDALKVKFTHSNTVRDRKAYTIYEIEVRSASTITWVIYKRYSDFFLLNQTLAKSFKMPTLPPKRMTRSLAAEFVEKRKTMLQEYLRTILASPALRHTEEMLKFLEVPDSVRPMLSRAKPDGGATPEAKDGDSAAREQFMSSHNYEHKSYDERRVLDLVTALSYNRNKVSAIKAFEAFFFEKRPRLDPVHIRLLLQGEHGAEKEGGLVQTCGDFPYSHVAARAALELLCRLVDVEKNKDAELFVDELASLEMHVLKRLQLHLHILKAQGNRVGAFDLMMVLQSRMPDLKVELVIKDDVAMRAYKQWAERKNESTAPAVSEPQDTGMRSLNLSESSYRQIAEAAFEEILAIAHNEQGWRQADYAHQAAAGGGGGGGADDGGGGEIRVKLCYKLPDPEQHITVLRLAAVLPHPVDAVTKLLIDLGRRREWDTMFQCGKRVEKLGPTADVAHMVYKSFSSPYKYRDFCLLRSWTKLESGGRMIATRSVLHPLLPEQKDNVRAILFPTGYIVTPVTAGGGADGDDGDAAATAAAAAAAAGSCLVTYVAQVDREGVLIMSPDLLGETNQMQQSINNLSALLDARASADA